MGWWIGRAGASQSDHLVEGERVGARAPDEEIRLP